MWTPKSIRIPSTPTPNGPSFIELMDIFSFTEDFGSIGRSPGPEHPSIYLPPDLYPPTWASRDAVTDTIILAAKDQANTMLVRSVARKQLDKHGEQRVVLKCSHGKTYYPWGKYKDRNDEINNIDNKVNHFPNYVPTIREDRMVNKDKAKRGTKKHEGKSMARRRGTTQKPIKGMECEFRFELKLVPGLYWRVLWLPPVHGSHNHLHHQKHELIVRPCHLTPEEKTIGGLTVEMEIDINTGCNSKSRKEKKLASLDESIKTGKEELTKQKVLLKRIQDHISRLEHAIEDDEKEKARIIVEDDDEGNNDESKISSNKSTSHHMKQGKKRKIGN